MEHTPKNCDTLSGPCGLTWDRQHNVKTIQFCPLHAAAPAMLEALEEGHTALLSAILFIEGAFPEPRGTILQQELTSYRMRELKARAAIEAAKGD